MWTLQDAKNKFSSVVDAAVSGRPQTITRRGRRAAVLVSAEAYDDLVRAARTLRPRFADHLLSFPADDLPRAQARPRDVSL